MRASHPLLVLFAGFAVTVALKSPGAMETRTPGALETPETPETRVTHKWNGGASQPSTTPKTAKTAAKTAPLVGRLIDVTGAPVGDVEVRDTRGGRITRAAADGRFSLPVAAERPVSLAVERAGRPARFHVMQGPEPVCLEIRPHRPWIATDEPAQVDLRGGDGVVSGAAGRVCITVCETGESVCIGGDGSFRIPIPNRPFRLLAYDVAGRVALSDEFAAPRAEQRWRPVGRLDLNPGLQVRGVVRDRQGRAVSGADLVLEGYGAIRRCRTDGSGAFNAAGLVPGTYVIRALPTEGQTGCSEGFVLTASAPVDLELSLQPERPLELTVVDEQGAAQGGVFVQVTEVGNTWSLGTTGDTGKVVIRGLGGGECQFDVFARAVPGTGPAFRAMEVVRLDAKEALLVVR